MEVSVEDSIIVERKTMKKILFSFLFLFMIVPAAYSAQWQIMGTRPMGMGGAFVGVAEGPETQYWNPAGLVKHDEDNYSGMSIPVGVNFEVTGKLAENAGKAADMADKFKKLSNKIDRDAASGNINADDIAALTKTLTILKDIAEDGNKGILADVNAGVGFKMSKVAFSVHEFVTAGFTPFIDDKNIGLGSTIGNGGTIEGVEIPDEAKTAVVPAGYDEEATAIQNVFQTIITVDQLNKLLGLTGGDAITEGQLANFSNWLIQQAIDSGMTKNDIDKAVDMISEYAAPAAVIIQNVVSGDDSTSYKNNKSRLKANAAGVTEISAGYAWDIEPVPGLSVGANLKMLDGMTVEYEVEFMKDGKADDFDYKKDVESTWKPAADIGVLWNIKKYAPQLPFPVRAGLVARNINSPKFKYKNGGNYTYDRQVRAGVSANPYPWLTVAADIDLTKNDTMVEGFYSRQAALGMEFNLVHSLWFNLPLRVGLINNIAENDSKMAYTAGVGLHMLHFQFDISGMVSSNTTEYKDKKYPVHGGVAAQLAILF